MSSPEVSELHQHLQALDGLEGLSKWPFSRKRSTPNTSPKRKSVTFFGDIQKFSAEIRAIENRTNELYHDNSIHSNAALRNLDSNRAESQRKFWLLSLGFISISLVCFIMFCVVPIILSSPLPKFPSRQWKYCRVASVEAARGQWQIQRNLIARYSPSPRRCHLAKCSLRISACGISATQNLPMQYGKSHTNKMSNIIFQKTLHLPVCCFACICSPELFLRRASRSLRSNLPHSVWHNAECEFVVR